MAGQLLSWLIIWQNKQLLTSFPTWLLKCEKKVKDNQQHWQYEWSDENWTPFFEVFFYQFSKKFGGQWNENKKNALLEKRGFGWGTWKISSNETTKPWYRKKGIWDFSPIFRPPKAGSKKNSKKKLWNNQIAKHMDFFWKSSDFFFSYGFWSLRSKSWIFLESCRSTFHRCSPKSKKKSSSEVVDVEAPSDSSCGACLELQSIGDPWWNGCTVVQCWYELILGELPHIWGG